VIFPGIENKRQGLGCGLDVIGCSSDMDNRADRSSGNSTLRGKLGSRIDDLEFVEVIYLNIEMFFDDIISQNKIRRK